MRLTIKDLIFLKKYLMEKHIEIEIEIETEATKKKLFVKITNSDEKHYNHQYVDGLNILAEPFTETGSCVSGGLYFTDIDHVHEFLHYGVNLRVVELPYSDIDFKCVPDGDNKWRANKIILVDKYSLADVETYQFLEKNGFCMWEHQDTIFRHAVKNNFMQVVEYLSQKFPKINFCNKRALQIAIINDNLAMVKFLTQKGYCNDFCLNILNQLKQRWLSLKSENISGHNFSNEEEYHYFLLDYLLDGIKIAICYGKFDVVKYLTSLIYVNKEYQYTRVESVILGTIILAQNKNQIDIVQYLGHWMDEMENKYQSLKLTLLRMIRQNYSDLFTFDE